MEIQKPITKAGYGAFGGNPLDRLNNRRKDDLFLDSLYSDERALFIPFFGLKALIRTIPDQTSHIQWFKLDELKKRTKENEENKEKHFELVFLGIDTSSVPYFAIDVSNANEADFIDSETNFIEVRASFFIITPEHAAILGQARCILEWHGKTNFCAQCGSSTKSIQGGSKRICLKNDKHTHFLRTDPCVIMLVTKGDLGLVGRQKVWPQGMHSTLAGFLEPGESVEEAVRREVLEEVGIKVGKVTYYGSQPWPYPSQLMIGCYAEALTEDIVLDEKEVEAAKWCNKDELRQGLLNSGGDFFTKRTDFRLPPPLGIAHHLVKYWLEQ